MPRSKGTPKTGGRQKGSPNKTTAAVKTYIADVLAEYMQPHGKTYKQPYLQADLALMEPQDRVRAMTQLAGYVIPKQHTLTTDEQIQMEVDALTQLLETAPDETINTIAAKVLEMQARNAERQYSNGTENNSSR